MIAIVILECRFMIMKLLLGMRLAILNVSDMLLGFNRIIYMFTEDLIILIKYSTMVKFNNMIYMRCLQPTPSLLEK